MGKTRTRKGRHRDQPDPAALKVGARIRTLRQERDFTFDAFVEELDMGRGYLSELERGLVVPSLTALHNVARALEITVADLVLNDSPREQIYALTAHWPEGQVKQLLETVRRTSPPPKARKPSKSSWPFPQSKGSAAERYKTALPLMSLRPAAGAYSSAQEGTIAAWLKMPAGVPVRRGLFVAQVSGRSMEPTIADGAFCLFQRPWPMPQADQIGIFMRADASEPEGFARYTLKQYKPRATLESGSHRVSGSLQPRNPAYAPLITSAADEATERPFARWLQVVG